MRIGITGTGRIGAFHAKTLLGVPGVDGLVVTDVVPESAAKVAAARPPSRISMPSWQKASTR